MLVVTSEEMRALDRYAIDIARIPSLDLMENAGRGVAERIIADYGPIAGKRVACFAGSGNNGGDGFVISRHLQHAGATVVCWYLAPRANLSPDAATNYDLLQRTHVTVRPVISDADILRIEGEFDIAIDAILGTGSQGPPRGLAAEMVTAINRLSVPVVACDAPTGIDVDNGIAYDPHVRADKTYALALPKPGLFAGSVRDAIGPIEIVPIGLTSEVLGQNQARRFVTTATEATTLLPQRSAAGHKGTFGKLLILAGSTGLTGASVLAAGGALRSGAGLVTVATAESVQPVIATKLLEGMPYALPEVRKRGVIALRALGEVRQLLHDRDGLVVGPGLGRHYETQELIRRTVSALDKPAVIDADGLYPFRDNLDYLTDCLAPLVLTPHDGELERLYDRPVPTEMLSRLELVREAATHLGVTLVLKGAPTIVGASDGSLWINPTGNDGLATGGTGDVLAGMIGTFLVQGLAPADAARLGVYAHGLAGDFAAEDFTRRGMVASDVVAALPDVWRSLETAAVARNR